METLLAKHWHHIPTEDIASLLESDLRDGLSVFEVKHRQAHFGPNMVTVQKRKSALTQFLLQFHQPLVYILLAAGGITAFLTEWADSSVILGVVLINAIVGFIQESKAEKALESLKRMVTTDATVLREGKKLRIPSVELVPGDIVLLQSGDKVPADMRLYLVRDLQIDESALTGESIPVEKQSDILVPDTILADRNNMAYTGTLVTRGQGQGIVVAIGDETETGRISQLISEAVDLDTPLTKKISKFSGWLLYVILFLATLTFTVGLLQGERIIDMFMASVALAVSAIPEGLPAAVTITLAIGVRKMAHRKAIIRRLPAVETLGSTTVICSDKTGTLTENQMTVQKIMAGYELYEVTGGGYTPEGEIIQQGNKVEVTSVVPLAECLTAGILCNDSQLSEVDGRWKVDGDPTEGALIIAAYKGGLSKIELENCLPRLDVIPFESHRQYMATLHNAGSGRSRVIYVKGAVEKILEKCSVALNRDGRICDLDTGQIAKMVEQMASEGLRVLAFARGASPYDRDKFGHADMVSGLTFLGLQAMIDPPRTEAIAAVRACKTAGISVKMITGDHALTAAAIAGKLGLNSTSDSEQESPATITGKELSEYSDGELIDVVEHTAVFARVAPEQKLRLVEALQARGHVVAMTGDGVNDAPALKQADIGIAMGVTGTDVAKEAADMVLTDDNFATIEAAVEEGRGIFDNLTKFIIWTLPTNGGESLVVLASIFAGITLPVLPVHILWINMTTAVLLGLMLAFEPTEAGIMLRPPRNPNKPILTHDLIGRIILVSGMMAVGVFGLFVWERWGGASLAEARTVAVNVFIMVELFYLFNCRSLTKSIFSLGLSSNPWVIGGSALMIMLQILFTYTPWMNRIFDSAPISLAAWGKILLIALTVYIVVGVEKWLRGHFTSRTQKIQYQKNSKNS